MEHDRQVAFRLSSSLVEEIDARADELRASAPGMRVTRADVVRAILVRALESEGLQSPELFPKPPVRERAPSPREHLPTVAVGAAGERTEGTRPQTGLLWLTNPE